VLARKAWGQIWPDLFEVKNATAFTVERAKKTNTTRWSACQRPFVV